MGGSLLVNPDASCRQPEEVGVLATGLVGKAVCTFPVLCFTFS